MEKISQSKSIIKDVTAIIGKISKVEKVTVALSNQVFKIINCKNQIFILKVFNKKLKKAFVRPQEIKVIKYMLLKKLTPKLISYNNYYILLEYIHSDLIFDLHNESLLHQLATALQELHRADLKINPRNFHRTATKYLLPLQYSSYNDYKNIVQQGNAIFATIKKFPKEYAVCHNDVNVNNILCNNNKLWLLDFEYSSINDIYTDLACVSKMLQNNPNSLNIFFNRYFQNHSKLDKNKLQIYDIMIDYVASCWAVYYNYQDMFLQLQNQLKQKLQNL